MSNMSSTSFSSFLDHVPKILFIFLIISVAGLEISIALSSIAFGIAGVLFIVLLSYRKEYRFRTPLDYAMLAYCIVELLATIFSIDRPASIINMKRLFFMAFVLITIISCSDEQRLRKMLIILFGTTALLSCFEIVDVLKTGPGVVRLGVFQDYMRAGGIKMSILLLTFPFIVNPSSSKRWRVWTLLSFMPIFFALILTETRSSWLGLLCGVGVYGLMRNKVILIGLIAFIVLFVLVAPTHWKDRAFSIFDVHQNANVERFEKWAAGSRMILDYPIVGTGDIDLGQIYDKYKEPADRSHGGHLHNNFMMLIVTLGIIGFTAVMFLFWKILRVELDAVRLTRPSWFLGNITLGSLCAYAGFQVNGMFEWNFGSHQIAVLLWFTVGLALAAAKLFSQHSDSVPS